MMKLKIVLLFHQWKCLSFIFEDDMTSQVFADTGREQVATKGTNKAIECLQSICLIEAEVCCCFNPVSKYENHGLLYGQVTNRPSLVLPDQVVFGVQFPVCAGSTKGPCHVVLPTGDIAHGRSIGTFWKEYASGLVSGFPCIIYQIQSLNSWNCCHNRYICTYSSRSHPHSKGGLTDPK